MLLLLLWNKSLEPYIIQQFSPSPLIVIRTREACLAVRHVADEGMVS